LVDDSDEGREKTVPRNWMQIKVVLQRQWRVFYPIFT